MNVRPEIIKVVEENIGSKLHDIGLAVEFLDLHPKQRQQRKNKQLGLYQTKNLVQSKEKNQQSEKTTYWIGENIQNIQRTQTTQ